MRTHTNEFKEELKVFGRQIKGKIIYYPSYNLVSENNDNILTEADLQIISEQANYEEATEINAEDIFSISIIKNGNLLQSLMKEFDFESKVELNIGSVVNPQFGLLVNEDYEYLNYGNYIINSKEFNMDTETWSYVCYDKMLFSMIKYRGLSNVEYPITIKQFINNLCNKVGLEFEDSTFVNQDQLIYEDLYKNRDVTYRDIFDEISKIVAGNLLINDSDKLEVGYPKKTIGKNLFDKDNIKVLNGYLWQNKMVLRDTLTDRIFYIPCQPNTTYTISRSVLTSSFRVATYNDVIPTVTSERIVYTCYNEINNNDGTTITITTDSNSKYLLVMYANINNDTNINESLASIQIEKGSIATEYEEYGLDKLNEHYLKDTNVRMSEKIGVINSVAILDSDNNLQYIAEDTQSIKENEMTRITITDNLIAMNGETQEIADNILNKLNGLYYYANDLQTTGVCYYDFLDMFNVEARGNIYQCLLLNNEITITQGIEEHIFTEKFEELETSKNEYTTSIISNKAVQFRINQQKGEIESKVEKAGVISAINQSAEQIQIQADKISLDGKNISLTAEDIEIYSEVHDKYTYTNNDISVLSNLIQSGTTPTSEQLDKYDLTHDGILTAEDLLWLQSKVFGYAPTGGTFKITGKDPQYVITTTSNTSQTNNLTTNIGLENISSHSAIFNFLVCFQGLELVSNKTQTIYLNASNGNVKCISLTQTSLATQKKNFERLKNAKEILNSTDIYKYHFKDEDNSAKKSIGFVIGDGFNYSKEITSVNNDGANIYSMVSVLWQVVKEQQEEIKELKEMIKNGKY